MIVVILMRDGVPYAVYDDFDMAVQSKAGLQKKFPKSFWMLDVKSVIQKSKVPKEIQERIELQGDNSVPVTIIDGIAKGIRDTLQELSNDIKGLNSERSD